MPNKELLELLLNGKTLEESLQDNREQLRQMATRKYSRQFKIIRYSSGATTMNLYDYLNFNNIGIIKNKEK